MRQKSNLTKLAIITLGGSTFCLTSLVLTGNHKFYSKYLMPVARRLDPEKSHNWSVYLCSKFVSQRFPIRSIFKDPIIATETLGMRFESPIGLAAGFDKDADCYAQLLNLGFGFVEIGTVTPLPQPGNPRPRLFRLEEQRAIINRMGFNSCGLTSAKSRLENRDVTKVVGVNLGINKNSNDAFSDYEQGISSLGPYASYIVINVSSPNTPGLRNLQHKAFFGSLLNKVVMERDKLRGTKPPILVKIAPDLTDLEIEDMCKAITANCVDGVIVSNTTIKRIGVESNPLSSQPGGLSGAPLKEPSTAMVKQVYRLTKGKVPIIAVGGVFTCDDVIEKLKSGASLVQMYSGFVYQGPTIINELNRELAERLKEDGFDSVSQLIGLDT